MEGDAEANWKLKIIKTEVWVVKPLINEVIQDFHIKEGQIVEDLRLLLALYQLLKSIIAKIVVARQINGVILISQNSSRGQCLTSWLHGLFHFGRLGDA